MILRTPRPKADLARELAETSGAEIAAPPTALHAKDLKSGYNVTTPAQSWLYWNTLQHRRSAEDVFDTSLLLAGLIVCERAFHDPALR